PQLREYIETGAAGEHEIQHHEIGAFLADRVERLHAGGGSADAIARFGQMVGDQGRDVGFVVDHEDPRRQVHRDGLCKAVRMGMEDIGREKVRRTPRDTTVTKVARSFTAWQFRPHYDTTLRVPAAPAGGPPAQARRPHPPPAAPIPTKPPAASTPATADSAHLGFVATSDLHGHMLGWDDVRDAEAPGGLSRAATIIGTLRTQYPGQVVLVDAGDLIEGNPFATYFARVAPARPHPFV